VGSEAAANKKGAAFGRACVSLPNTIVTCWTGKMGHGWELYCVSGMNELGDFEVFRGLDKIWRVALGMVQMGGRFTSGRQWRKSHRAARMNEVCAASALLSGLRLGLEAGNVPSGPKFFPNF
jgi:hypothetical protein